MTISDPALRTAVKPTPTRSSRYRSGSVRSPISTRRFSAPKGRLIQRVTELLREPHRAAGACSLARFRAHADRSEMAEHRARHRRRADRTVRGGVGGPPHRAAAGIDRELDPRGGGRREERLDPGDRRRQRDRRHRACRRSVPPNPGRCRHGARGGGARARRAAARRRELPQAVRVLGRRNLRHDAGRRTAQRQSGAGADDGIRDAAGADQRHRRHRRAPSTSIPRRAPNTSG